MVTFGGSCLNRASALRGSDEARPREGDLFLVHWRGKFAVDLKNACEIALLRYPHKLISHEKILFLGKNKNTSFFAVDISKWEPAYQEEPSNSFFDRSQQVHELLGEDLPFWELRRFMHLMSREAAELASTAKSIFHWHSISNFCPKCGQRVSLVASGWQIDCKNCGSSSFPRIDPVVIMLITRGPFVLLGRSIGWPDGMYSLLAGFMEPGETIEASVRRETLEESGIEVGKVKYLASQPWAFPNSLMFGCYGTAKSEEITIDHSEMEDIKWFNKRDLHMTMAGLNDRFTPARPGSIAHFLLLNWLADTLEES